jgi:Mn-containing catalase
MLNKGVKGKVAEGLDEASELLAELTQGGESHTTSILYGGGAALVNSAGVPWTAAYVDTIGDPTSDLRSNIAAEARAKIIYERLMNIADDPGVREALGFLMTREIAHQKSFEKALYAIQPNFPPGKQPGVPAFTNIYYDMSQGDATLDGDMEGPWNSGAQWNVVRDREKQGAVDGGDGSATVKLSSAEKTLLTKTAQRTASNPNSNPMTGAELGAGSAAMHGNKPAGSGEGPLDAVKDAASSLLGGNDKQGKKKK